MDKGNKSELRKLINEQYKNVAGIIVQQDHNIVYEDYFDGSSEGATVHVASVAKSILSALIGIAVDKGAIQSINQNFLDYFPGYTIKRRESTIQKITIKHLLTMTAPYKYKYEPYTRVYSSEDWTKAVLDLSGGTREIGNFQYTTVGIQILSGLLANATGQSVLGFASENLFEPLGINTPRAVQIQNRQAHFDFLKGKHISGWVMDPQGVNTGGWGLALTTRDMNKIGQLYLDQGVWCGSQIISSKWIKDSTREHSRWGERPYGYLWWIIPEGGTNGFAALGDGGNVIYIAPDKKLVVAISSRFIPRARDRIEMIRKHIEPAL